MAGFKLKCYCKQNEILDHNCFPQFPEDAGEELYIYEPEGFSDNEDSETKTRSTLFKILR